LELQVLGGPARDNALLLRVDSGHSITRLLFDCGEGCVSSLPLSEIQAIDHLFFSHFHMDHVAGFDSYFRANFNRLAKANVVWGPAGTAAILHHRLQGFWWNLQDGSPGSWLARDLHPHEIADYEYKLGESFREEYFLGSTPRDGAILKLPDCEVSALAMEHHGVSMAYLARETTRWNFDAAKTARSGLPPGPWMKQLKDAPPGPGQMEVAGQVYEVAELRERLLVETPGDSVAYVTDLRLDEPGMERLADFLRGCGTILCECQYRATDADLAERNHHLTTRHAAELARRAGARELVLFHISSRYPEAEWPEILAECRETFPNTRYPESWGL